MAVQTIREFTPQLVTALSDHVQTVSDMCLSEGLITSEQYKRILDSIVPYTTGSARSARILLNDVTFMIGADDNIFYMFVDGILKKVPPSGSMTQMIGQMKSRLRHITLDRGRCHHVSSASDPVQPAKVTEPGSIPSHPVKSREQTMSMIPLETATVASGVRVIEKFTVRLVPAISGCIEKVAEHCVANGLISDGKYRELLQPLITEDRRARDLLIARD